ncbi:MAG: inositol monophosphatase, partial [Buchnera aphidicola]|nr:inositol monophosphatase [Buchnera aphidicola]MDE5285892.1 inositol monophosphatase [Buchnera aphidicola]
RSHIILDKNNYSMINENKKIYWVINELDGKNNFSKYLPHFCISIAIIIKGITEISVIYDPIKNDLFTSVKGHGSQLNGYRIRCTNTNTLESIIIAVNLPDNIHYALLPY